jgi:lipoprotein signal peptidase
MRLVAALGGIVLILDQAVTWLALRRLGPGVPVHVIDGFFSLTLVMNPGLAFGMLGTVPRGWRWIVALLSIGALGVLRRWPRASCRRAGSSRPSPSA